MVLKNYIELQTGIPARLHFVSLQVIDKEVTDSLTRVTMMKRSLYGVVDRLDGQEVSTTFSTLSEKLAEKLKPYADNGTFPNLEFAITKFGVGFTTRYQVEIIPFRP